MPLIIQFMVLREIYYSLLLLFLFSSIYNVAYLLLFFPSNLLCFFPFKPRVYRKPLLYLIKGRGKVNVPDPDYTKYIIVLVAEIYYSLLRTAVLGIQISNLRWHLKHVLKCHFFLS